MQTIDSGKLDQWLTQQAIVLIDIRDVSDYERERIAGAFWLPLDRVNEHTLKPFSGKRIVFYCQSSMRSNAVATKISKLMPDQEIFHLNGGINTWKMEGHQTQFVNFEKGGDKAASCPAVKPGPIQQTYIAIGSFLILFTMLGQFVNKGFFFVPTFMGGMLIIAGWTNWCMLTKIIMKMPWNRN